MKFNIFNRPHVMFDLETLSTQQNASIVSIGAVSFTFENGIEHEFLVNIDPKSNAKYGLHVDPDTIEWWMQQPKEVRNSWRHNAKPVEEALDRFNSFIGDDPKQMLWAHGAVFDIGALRFSMEQCKIVRNWKYWNEMDNRTIFNLLGIRNDLIREKEGSYHSALDDARSQAQTLISHFKDLQTVEVEE